MWTLGDVAEWWDKQHRISKDELNRFVDNNPNLFCVIVATAVGTAMEIGAGTVDTLRFGQGIAEGGLKGFGKDTLRLVGLLGPLGRAGKMVQASANTRIAKLIVDPGGGICGWISATQAMRQTGTKAFVAVDDLAKAMGKTVMKLGGSHLSARVSIFREIGARISPIKSVKSLDDIAGMTKNDGSVTIFNIFGKRMVGGRLKDIGHAVYAYRNNLGRLKIMDRGGSAGKTGEVFDSLAELAKKYSLQGQWSLKQAAVMENIFAKTVSGVSNAPVFAMNVYALAGVNSTEQETVAQAFEIHKKIMRQGKKILEGINNHFHSIVTGENLSTITNKYYSDKNKWPVIYEANRDIIGNDPNIIKTGQRLWIPVLPEVSIG